MSVSTKTVYLHIGLHKTGTTYLQNVFAANRQHCAKQGVDYPGGPDGPSQSLAVFDVQGRRPRGTGDARLAGQWAELISAVDRSPHPTVLISAERLSQSSLRQVKRVVESFREKDVHVIVTVRDLGRRLVSSWQEAIKNDTTDTWREYAAAVKDPARRMTDPARGFWSRHDLVAICETWAAVVPPSHLHVVTVPQSGASPTVLLERVCSVVRLDASTLVEQPKQANEMVGVAGTEVIRQINVRLDGRLHQRQYDRVVKAFLVRALAQSTNAARFAVPEEELGWLTKLSEETVVALQRAGYDIVGDLGDLMPRADPASRRPDDASQAELLETALDSAALLTEEFATAWWQRRKPDRPGRTNVASAARGLAFRTQRGLVHLADRNRLAAKGLGVVMARRSRAVRRRASRP